MGQEQRNEYNFVKMNVNELKMHLLIAGIAGMLTALLVFIGGIVTAEDKDPDLERGGTNTRYACGFMQVEIKGWCSFGKADRGWFKRVHEAIIYNVSTWNTNINPDSLYSLAGYEAVLAYAILLGLGWLLAGALALASALIKSSNLALAAGIIFTLLYVIFAGIFGGVWSSQVKIEKDCQPVFDHFCLDFKDLLTRSSREFLGYSICAFIIILYCIIVSFIASCQFEEPAKEVSQGANVSSVAISPRPSEVSPRTPKDLTTSPDNKPLASLPTPKKKITVVLVAPNPRVTYDTTRQFQAVNKYLTDEPILNQKVDSKFGKMNKNSSGAVVAAELESFVAEAMKKKNLPAPRSEDIATILKKYDKDKSGKMEKAEFKLFLSDIYMIARENLVRKYAKGKAQQLRATKPPVADTSGAKELEGLLQTSAEFYYQFDLLLKEAKKDKCSRLRYSEVADLCSSLCTKYKVPTLSLDEIGVIMKDMGRPIKEYDINDIRLASFAILSTFLD